MPRRGETHCVAYQPLHSKGLFGLIITVQDWKRKEAPWQTPDRRAWGHCSIAMEWELEAWEDLMSKQSGARVYRRKLLLPTVLFC